jgi:hypothetical protein
MQNPNLFQLSSRQLGYLQQLEQLFQNIDPDFIRQVIVDRKNWQDIVDALLDPMAATRTRRPSSIAQTHDPKLSQQLSQRTRSADTVGIPTAAHRVSEPSRLYLPESLIGIDMDLDTFGYFGDYLPDPRFSIVQ